MTEQYLGYELVPQEGYMQPDKYEVRIQCLRCNHIYKRVLKSLNDPDPPCPKKKCIETAAVEMAERRAANAAAVFESGTFPGVTGDKPIVKAVDAVAEQVMVDYKLTDLKDNIRPGESMVPKLPPAQQAAADNFFSGNAGKAAGINSRQMNMLGKRAIAGAFRGSAVSPGQVFPGRPGESALRHVRTDKIG